MHKLKLSNIYRKW